LEVKRALVILLATAAVAARAATPPAAVPTPAGLEKPARKGAMHLNPEDKARMIAERTQLAAAKRAQAIKLLEELLAMNPGDDAASDATYKLAELYWEDSRQSYAQAMAAYDTLTESCRQRGTAADAETCHAQAPKLDVARSERLYATIVEKYPRFKHLDVTLYLLGFGAHESGRGAEAVKYLTRLIDEHPGSELLPDAWMMLGEHWFTVDFAKARTAYLKVLEHKESPVYDLALFKTAWCDWKLGDTKRAAERFKEVLDLASAAEKSGSEAQQRRSVQLREEALQYLTLLFTEDESITAKDAYDFLASIGGERYSREVLGRLAELFFQQGRYDRAIQAWQHLIGLDGNHPDAPRHQLRVVDAFLAMDFADEAVGAAKALVTGYGPGSPWAKANRAKVVEEVDAQIEDSVAGLAKRMHGDAQADEERRKKPDLKAYRRAADLYAFYLTRYAETGRAGELRFLRAEILYFKLGESEAAGDEYMVVGQAQPKSDRNRDALLKAMAAYEKLRPKDAAQRKKVTAADRKFAAAVDAFAREYPADPQVVLVIYRNGQMFYDYGDYDEAVKRFGLIVTKYPDDANAGAAGDRILEALAKGEDYANIEEWARKLKGARSFQAPAEKQRLDEIIVQAIGKQAEKQIKDGKNEDAAATYLRAVKEYPQDRRAPASLVAAGVTLEAAREPVRAAEAYLTVVEKYPNDKQAAGAAFSAGRVYESMAYFDKAADAYEIVAYKFPSDAKASDALYNVIVLDQALGQAQQAIKAAEEYERRYPRQKDIEDVGFRVARLHAEAGEPAKAAQAFAGFLKRYPTSARGVEAETRAGRAEQAAGHTRAADEALGRALARWKKLKRPQQHDTARWAAEARYLEGEAVFRDYQAIALDVRPAALKKALGDKKALLAKAQGIYTDVVGYGDPTWATASLYRIGQIYEQFADELRKLPPPPGLSEDELSVYRDEVERYVVEMEDKAASIYQTGYKKALDLKVYGETTRQLRQGLGRLSPGKFPPEREARARARVGDRAPEPEVRKDVAGE
jgi:TolA-binding protein